MNRDIVLAAALLLVSACGDDSGVSESGTMSWSGDAGGTTMTCTASMTAGTIEATCNPTCLVKLERP